MLPGKDLLQPLATATGLVRSAASARAEVAAPAEASGNGRRRRGGRGRNGSEILPAIDTDGAELPEVSTEEAQEPATARRQDPELVAVAMTSEQEEVYGTLGLNPLLLLDEPPESDNVMVRIVRPGEDADAVLELARQQLAATAGRRRRRGGRGGRGSTRGNGASTAVASDVAMVEIAPLTDQAAANTVEDQPLMVEITPLVVTEVSESAPAAVAVEADPGVKAPEPEVEEPRRRRRRSSAASS